MSLWQKLQAPSNSTDPRTTSRYDPCKADATLTSTPEERKTSLASLLTISQKSDPELTAAYEQIEKELGQGEKTGSRPDGWELYKFALASRGLSTKEETGVPARAHAESQLEKAILLRYYLGRDRETTMFADQYARGRLHQHRETLAGGGRGTVPEALRDDDKFSSMVEDYIDMVMFHPATKFPIPTYVDNVKTKAALTTEVLMKDSSMTPDQARWYCLLTSVPSDDEKPGLRSRIKDGLSWHR